MKHTLKKEDILFKLGLAATFGIAGLYATFLGSISKEQHAELGHAIVNVWWSEAMRDISAPLLITALMILFLSIERYWYVIIGAILFTAFSVNAKSDRQTRNVGSDAYHIEFEKFDSPRVAGVGDIHFTEPASIAQARAFNGTIQEVKPKLWDIATRTANYTMDTAVKAATDPRFNWAFTGTPPTAANIEAMKNSINESTKRGLGQ